MGLESCGRVGAGGLGAHSWELCNEISMALSEVFFQLLPIAPAGVTVPVIQLLFQVLEIRIVTHAHL